MGSQSRRIRSQRTRRRRATITTGGDSLSGGCRRSLLSSGAGDGFGQAGFVAVDLLIDALPHRRARSFINLRVCYVVVNVVRLGRVLLGGVIGKNRVAGADRQR